MRINTRFPVAVHILSLIVLSDKPVTSEMMALSAGSHPVAIRQVISSLKKTAQTEKTTSCISDPSFRNRSSP